MNSPNLNRPPAPPYVDWNEPAVQKDAFSGIVWFPTAVLRFVNRDVYIEHVATTQNRRILQQQWETRTVRNSGTLQQIKNPHYTQWRDVPLEDE